MEEIKKSVQRLTNKDLKTSNYVYQLHDLDPFENDRPKRPHPGSHISRKKQCQDDGKQVTSSLLIGLNRGESSFTVDPLHEDWGEEQSVPREDGREWPEGFEGEGGHYEGTWRTEEEHRRQLLEKDKNYQFLILVAGSANTVVEQLYEEGDISAAVRRQQSLLTQQRIALEEVRASTKEVAGDVQNLTVELERLRGQRKQLRNVLVESDRLIQAFAFVTDTYEQEMTDRRQIRRKANVFSKYTDTVVITDEEMASIKDTLIEAANHEIRMEHAEEEEDVLLQSLTDAVVDVESGEKEDVHLNLAEAFINLWFFRDDSDSYARFKASSLPSGGNAIRRTYMLTQLESGGPLESEIRNAIQLTEAAEMAMLKRFYDVLFFLDQGGVLAIDPRDIYLTRPLAVTPQEENVPLAFDPAMFKTLYTKYGGTLFRRPGDPTIQTEEYRTSEFRAIYEDIVAKSLEDADLKHRLERVRAGPYFDELKVYREWIRPKIPELDKDIDLVSDQLTTSRARLSRLRSGQATFRDVEQPYRHRRQWVEAPEHSGIVRIKPIVVQAIDRAFKWVQRETAYGTTIDVDFMQYDTEIRGDFATLVAIEMSIAVMRFPKQYLQLGLRAFSQKDRYDTVQRLITGYKISRDTTLDVPEYRAKTLSRDQRNAAFGTHPMLRDQREFLVFN